LRARRAALPSPSRDRVARAVAQTLLHARPLADARRVAGYLANGGEVDLRLALEGLRAQGRQTLLPVLCPTPPGSLRFAPYDQRSRLHPNRFGIAEPAVPIPLQRRPLDLDLVLLPLVAFDARGNRLGMGGGYYDRSFAALHSHGGWRRPRLIGVAYAFQEVDRLPAEAWDVPLDGVLTEHGLRLFAAR
jgi:5-formyltetrahydrofolate cyclo-ligase